MNLSRCAAILSASFLFSFASHGGLIITGVIDGPLAGGTPKAIELFATSDISDLSAYGFGSANNGDGSDGEEFTFAGTATAGDFLYVSYEGSEFANFFGFVPDFVAGAANINGDDAVELFENGSVVDVFGAISTDGTGEPWEYMDGWAYRKDGTGPGASSFILGDWSISGINALDDEATNATAANPFPIGTYTIPEPSVIGPLTVLLIGPLLLRRRVHCSARGCQAVRMSRLCRDLR